MEELKESTLLNVHGGVMFFVNKRKNPAFDNGYIMEITLKKDWWDGMNYPGITNEMSNKIIENLNPGDKEKFAGAISEFIRETYSKRIDNHVNVDVFVDENSIAFECYGTIGPNKEKDL